MTHASRPTVLIVDDRDNWRKLFAQLLEDEFKVATAASYEEAVDAVARQEPPHHVVVTDLRLDDRDTADMGGLRLAEKVKTSGASTQVIVVTGYETYGSQEKAYRDLGVYKYLLKYPGGGKVFDHIEFQETVRSAAEKAEAERGRFAFVLMPFADQYKVLYDDTIKPTVHKHHILCQRADDFFESRQIMDTIHHGIEHAELIIADFSGKNANVFYEVGIAHATGKTPLLITQSLDDVPPKLRTLRHIVYEDSFPGDAALKANLDQAIGELLAPVYQPTPVFEQGKTGSVPNRCLALIPPDRTSQSVYTHLVQGVCTELRLHCLNFQEVFSVGTLLDAMWQQIVQARLIIADLSERDPDVFYLMGLAHGLKKDVIMLTRSDDDVPFDLRNRSWLLYDTSTFQSRKESTKTLTLRIRGVMGDELSVEADPLSADEHSRLQYVIRQYGLDSEPEKLVNVENADLEKILGVNNLKQMAWLQRGLQVAVPVCRIHTPKSKGTGFLIGNGLLMTNNHVIRTIEDAEQTVVEFNYQLDLAQNEETTVRYSLDPTRFRTSKELDYTIVGVLPEIGKADLAKWGHPLLNPYADPIPGEHVSIVQHPNGGPKQIVLTANQVIKTEEKRLLHYTTDTMPGSSGSPVFNDSWQVIAIHHAGGILHTNAAGDTRYVNEGILMSAIRQHAGDYWPQETSPDTT